MDAPAPVEHAAVQPCGVAKWMAMATGAEHATAAEDQVPWQQLIAFGLGGLIPIALFNIVLQLVPLVGNISLGISAVWLGAVLVLPRLWEALSDPARAAAIREFVIAWYRAEQWLNDNKQIWIDEYLIKDQKVSPEDAKAIAAADGKSSVPGFTDELINTQQETIDLLQQAGAFSGKELHAKDEFDSRFADLNATSTGKQ